MTRTIRKRGTDHPTRDGNHNPICKDPDNCEDCGDKEWNVQSVIKNVKILVITMPVVGILREVWYIIVKSMGMWNNGDDRTGRSGCIRDSQGYVWE